ncbi:hypothetical protein L9F63_000209, partial [Diploptera punctata]
DINMEGCGMSAQFTSSTVFDLMEYLVWSTPARIYHGRLDDLNASKLIQNDYIYYFLTILMIFFRPIDP